MAVTMSLSAKITQAGCVAAHALVVAEICRLREDLLSSLNTVQSMLLATLSLATSPRSSATPIYVDPAKSTDSRQGCSDGGQDWRSSARQVYCQVFGGPIARPLLGAATYDLRYSGP